MSLRHSMPFARVVGLALGFATLATVARAQSAHESGAARSVEFTFENDLIAARGAGAPPDHDYTHGTRVALAWAGAPRWVARVLRGTPGCRSAVSPRRACVASALTVGQAIYTPRVDAPQPVAGERPYTGWLSVSAAARRVESGRVRSATVEAGVTGRPSLAQEVQGEVHRLLGNAPQLGWAHQLSTRPGVTIRYDEARVTTWTLGDRGSSGLRLRWGAAAGSVVTGASAGADITLGRGRAAWDPQEPEVARPPRLYALAGYRQDVVLRNAFVEGWHGETWAERRPFVGQLELGAGYRWRALAVEYRYVARGREYRAQPAPHAWGAVAITASRF